MSRVAVHTLGEDRSCFWNQIGISMLELAIILPMILIVIAGLVDVSAKISTVKVLTTASAYGSRIASTHSRAAPTAQRRCGDAITEACPAGVAEQPIAATATITDAAFTATCNYLRSARLNAEQWTISTRTVPTPAEDGIAGLPPQIEVEIRRTVNDCIICYEQLFQSLLPKAQSAFILENNCNP